MCSSALYLRTSLTFRVDFRRNLANKPRTDTTRSHLGARKFADKHKKCVRITAGTHYKSPSLKGIIDLRKSDYFYETGDKKLKSKEMHYSNHCECQQRMKEVLDRLPNVNIV